MRPNRIPVSRLLAILLLIVAGALPTRGAEPVPSSVVSANAEAREWFEDARLGLFIHWGLDSLLGKGVLVMDDHKIPIAEYEKLPPRFNPTEFEADVWVKTARSAGAHYIVVTSKHHDGFCM